MTRRASEGIQELIDHVGQGRLKARVRFDQAYAQEQHEDMTLKHRSGGGAKFLERSLFEGANEYYQYLAKHVLAPEQGTMVDAMSRVGGEIRDGAARRSPHWLGDLARSGAVSVLEGARVVRREPPEQGRLTEEELAVRQQLWHEEFDRWTGSA